MTSNMITESLPVIGAKIIGFVAFIFICLKRSWCLLAENYAYFDWHRLVISFIYIPIYLFLGSRQNTAIMLS